MTSNRLTHIDWGWRATRQLDQVRGYLRSEEADLHYTLDATNERAQFREQAAQRYQLLMETLAPLQDRDPTLHDEILSTYTRRLISEPTADHERLLARQARLADNIATYRRRVAEMEAQLQRDQKQQPVTEIRRLLKAFPHIADQGISIRNGRTSPSISWTFQGLLLRPDENPYPWLDGGDIPTLALPDIRVTLRVYQQQFRIRCAPGAQGFPGYIGRTVPHPHVLYGDAPCLGDWAAPIQEALTDGDLKLAIELLQMFLEHAANGDPAGRTWIRLVSPWITPGCFTGIPAIPQRNQDGELRYYRYTTCPDTGTVSRTETTEEGTPLTQNQEAVA